MKYLFLILAASFSVSMSSCQSTKQTQTQVINAVTEDHSTSVYDFATGEYYSYRFADTKDQGFDVQQLISTLVKEKIPVTDLWYKFGSRSCLPPGSEMAMDVIVRPVLLIRLEKPNLAVLKLGFSQINLPEMGDCAYRVKRYRF
ncbi:MAG: hypothetical protein HOO86_07230 [Bacteroidales bacterium]|nr:hypothetical protein [Bacteroidales bacterium]